MKPRRIVKVPKTKAPAAMAIRLALGMFEALRRLGVPSEEIFVREEDGQLYVLARDRKFPMTDYAGDIEKDWPAAAEWWNKSGSTPERQVIWLHFLSGVDSEKMKQLKAWTTGQGWTSDKA
jgi:hypothetical protein